MKKIKWLVMVILSGLFFTLAGCAHQDLKTPCPDFGEDCNQVPINSWNYQK
jgi:hypothetical protein